MRQREDEPSKNSRQPDSGPSSNGAVPPSTERDQFETLWEEMEKIDAEINSLSPTLTVMFIEICSKDKIILRYGDIESYRILRRFGDTCVAEVRQYKPEFVQVDTGDEILLGFQKSQDCLEAALAFLQVLEKNNQAAQQRNPKHLAIQANVGVNRGPVLYNKGVLTQCNVLNFGKRLQQLAGPGQILISHSVFKDLDGSGEFNIITRGNRQFRNIPEPQPVYEVYWRDDFASAYTSGLVFETQKPDLSKPPTRGLPTPYQYAARQTRVDTDANIPQPEISHQEVAKTDSADQPVAHHADRSQAEQPGQPEISDDSESPPASVLVSLDGEPGCFPSISDALAASEEGTEIVIRTGNYEENVFINLNDITLRASEFANVTIRPKFGIPLEIRKASNVTVQGLTLFGNHADIEQPTCLQIESSDNISIDDCILRGTPGTGCLIHSSIVSLRKTSITSCQRGGIFARSSSDVIMEHCHITDNMGCELHRANVTGCGILASQSTVLKVQDCVVGGNEGSGVSVVGNSSHVEMKKCEVRGNGVVKIRPGVYIEGAKGSLDHCQIRENGGAGIYAKYAAVTLKKNKVQSNGALCKPPQPGIYLVESPKTKTLGNYLDGNGVDQEKHIRVSAPAEETVDKGNAKEPEKEKASPMWFRGLRGGRRVQKPRERQDETRKKKES